MRVDPVPPGSQYCPDGGKIITAWVDSNPDGQLDGDEKAATSHVCNGPSGALIWVPIDKDQQAQRNTGYYVISDAPVVVHLPTEGDLPTDLKVGDTVGVQGIGKGGWTIAQNDGQVVEETPPSQSPLKQWSSVASSSLGDKLVAAASDGGVYTSTDGGSSWTEETEGLPAGGNWAAVASSADGKVLVAAAQPSSGGRIYVRREVRPGIVGWADTGTIDPTEGGWHSLASSADGRVLVAAANLALFWSDNYGADWHSVFGSAVGWGPVAVSPDGSTVVVEERVSSKLLTIDVSSGWVVDSAGTRTGGVEIDSLLCHWRQSSRRR